MKYKRVLNAPYVCIAPDGVFEEWVLTDEGWNISTVIWISDHPLNDGRPTQIFGGLGVDPEDFNRDVLGLL